MLDPYYIVNLVQLDQGKSTYYAQFKVPERLGIYKFMINHFRYGYTYVNEELEVSIIPYQHDEFPRF